MKIDLLLKNGQVVFPYEGMVMCDIGVHGGKVVGIYGDAAKPGAASVIDVDGKLVLPGMIDFHTHIGMGSNIENEYDSECRSAAAGGITTVMSYTNCTDSYLDYFRHEKKVGEEKSIIDFALHFGLMNEKHLKEIPRYIEELGVSSFKFFMNFRGEEGKYMGVEGIDDGFMFDSFRALSQYPLSCAVIHAENIEVGWRLRDELMAQGRDDLMAWDESKPRFIEAEAIERALFYGQVTGCQVYIAHVTTKEGLEVVRKYKQKNPRIHCETCTHYLTFTSLSGLGSLGKTNPPLRQQSDIEALWEGVDDGSIDAVTSDHVGRKKEKKMGTIWKASGGFPGVATTLPILLSEGVHKRGLKIERIAEMNYKTARIFNLYPTKGTIRIGSDADFTVVDLDLERTLRVKDLKSACDYSLYEGWKIKGWPVITMVRGQVIMKDGEITAKSAKGAFVSRAAAKKGVH
jgi:dihydropyrimidinase